LFQTPHSAKADVKNKQQSQVIFKHYIVDSGAVVYALGLESNRKRRQLDTDEVLTAEVSWSEM